VGLVPIFCLRRWNETEISVSTRASERIEALIEPALTAMGYELVGVEYAPLGHGGTLRVYIDKPGGVTLDDCERVSHQVSGVLDVEDPIHSRYDLEVSSPGVERPLFRAGHYARFAGSRVRIRTFAPIEGQRNFSGVLRGVIGDEVLLEEEGRTVRIALSNIAKAHLAPELSGIKQILKEGGL